MLNPALNQLFAAPHFTLEITHDGSPTLRLNSSQESMHHFDGAACETWYVYGVVLERALELLEDRNISTFKIASVGLGLGYIELAWALLLGNPIVQKINMNWTLDSFEISDDLRYKFKEWLTQPLTEASAIYDLALSQLQIASHLKSDSVAQIKNRLGPPAFQFHSDLLNYSQETKWNFICFDAFSKNTDANLWTEDYLNYFLQRFAATDCVFTTYAATSVLKKVLIQNNFIAVRRLGYSGKRECTLAVRGAFTGGFAIFQTF